MPTGEQIHGHGHIALCPHCGPKHGPQTLIPPIVVHRHNVWSTVQVVCPVCSMSGPGESCYETPARSEVVANVIKAWNDLPRTEI